MKSFDSNQIAAFEFYLNQFKNNWKEYREVAEQRNEKREYLKNVLSRENIDKLTEDDITKIVSSLWTGSLFPKNVVENNELSSIKKSFKFLLYGEGEPFDRLEKVCKDPQYSLKNIGKARVSELLGKVSDVAIVNEPVENLANRLGYKFTFKEIGTAEWAKQYDEFVRSIHNVVKLDFDQTDFLIFFIDNFSDFMPGVSEPLPRFKNGEFLFVEEDFTSTTGNEHDARFLYQRFNLLLKSLKVILPPKFVNNNAYTGRPWNQGKRPWNSYSWIGFAPNPSEDKAKQIQFQVSLHQDQYLSNGIWVDHLAEEKIDKIRLKIEQKPDEFFNLVKTLPGHYTIGVWGSSNSWEGKEYSIEDFSRENLNELLDLLSRKKAEFYINYDLEKPTVLNQKLAIINTIKNDFEILWPIYEYFEGKTESKYFVLTSYPDSDYDDIEGEQYHYDSNKPNHTKLVVGSKIIWLGKNEKIPYFMGHGTVKDIKSLGITKDKGRKKTELMAIIENYKKFDTPKPRTDQAQQMLEDLPEYGNIPPSILPIPKKIYDLILGNTENEIQMEQKLSYLERLLNTKKQIIFYGPPGTGKTYRAITFAKEFVFGKMSDEKFENLILNQVKEYANQHNYEMIKEDESFRLYKLKNTKKEIRIGFHFSSSEKRDLERSYVGVSTKMVNFLNGAPLENRFEIIVNDSVKRFIVLPESLKKQYAKFSDSATGNWDPSGNAQHSYHIIITENSAKLKTKDGVDYDCSNLLDNLDVLNLSQNHNSSGYIRNVTFHQSYSYEEFVEGIKPKIDDKGQLAYEIEDGIFKRICNDARKQPQNKFVLVIDEINRGNISKILGELITLLDNDKRETFQVNLAYSKERFTVPKNVFIICTMNTADRSLVQIDVALRRRFGFIELLPRPELLDDLPEISLAKLLKNLNQLVIEHTKNREFQIGHSYFMKDGKSMISVSDVKFAFETEIIPLLQEYFYDDYYELEKVLGPNFVDTQKQLIIQHDSEADFLKALGPILEYGNQQTN